mgnify:FL=1
MLKVSKTVNGVLERSSATQDNDEAKANRAESKGFRNAISSCGGSLGAVPACRILPEHSRATSIVLDLIGFHAAFSRPYSRQWQ